MGTSTLLLSSRSFLQRINSSNEFQIDYKEESWLIDFYKNACVFQNQSRSIMAMLDYMELLIRLVSIYYYEKSTRILIWKIS